MKTFASTADTPRWVSVFRHAPAITMTPGLRKFMLTLHITSSIGWAGAVAGFLVLAVTGVTSQDVQLVRAADLAMELITRFVIVPLAFAALLTGLVQSLGTPWGLFRHYWVLVKLLLTLFATIVLLLKTQLIDYLAGVAGKTTLSTADLGMLRSSELVGHAAGGLVVLLVAAVLSVYKPWGITRYGWRKQREESRRRQEQRRVLLPRVGNSSPQEVPRGR